MLSNTLVTNEVKDASGTEVEFNILETSGRSKEFFKSGETPSAPYRITVDHTVIGAGVNQRRRSKVGIYKTIAGQVDTTVSVAPLFYIVGDIPIGNMTSYTEAKNVLANLLSFCASLGASTTILYDCTGNGADVLINGGL